MGTAVQEKRPHQAAFPLMKTSTIDPVCGMTVKDTSMHRTSHGGMVYHFCSEKCLGRFERNPQDYVDKDVSDPANHAGDGDQSENRKRRDANRGKSWRDYVPLLVLILLTLGAASAKQYSYPPPWDWTLWMHDFMGLFLIVFSMFKFFNINGFADGFQMYDLLASSFRPYAYVYPFLELGLGLGYLAWFQPAFIYTATVVLMTFGSLGVFRALATGLDVNCACMGSVLNVPLSTVALVEDLGMASMALMMLFLM
jgi:YHS domain-containing protein